MQKFNCCLYSYSTQTSPIQILKVQTRKQPEMNFHPRKHIRWSLFFKQQFFVDFIFERIHEIK